jgi:VWFA-related protein
MFRADELFFGMDITRRGSSLQIMKHVSAPMSVLSCALILGIVASSSGFPASQQTVRVESSFVQIDATVTDKDGNRVRDLKAENFRVLEDGKAQKISGVDYCDVHQHGTDIIANPVSIGIDDGEDMETLRAIGASHRLIVLFFDRSAMDPPEILHSVDAARAFVKDQMTPADLVTIASYGTQLEVNSDFTNDRGGLDKTLESLIPGKKSDSKDSKARMDDSVSKKNGTRNVEHSLDAAMALAEMLAGIPGRKSVMHFTSGLLQNGMNNLAAVDAATGAANRNNVSFFEVDARALKTICGETPCANAADVARQYAQLADSRNTLSTLAKDTNGALFTDMNDFKAVFKRVLDESTGYYLLTYDPSNKKKDGSYRQIEIKLVDVPGGRIVFRHGYYAPRK